MLQRLARLGERVRQTSISAVSLRPSNRSSLRGRWNTIWVNRGLYLMFLPPLVVIIVFRYVPMYGAQLAFKRFLASEGVLASPWVGLANFERFFRSYNFWTLLVNTFALNVYQLLAGFPMPIVLALMIFYCPSRRFKKTVQMVSYAPYFISVVVIVDIIFKVLSPRGLVNHLIRSIGARPVNFLAQASYFRSIFVWSGVWQTTGWGTIIYLAALSSVSTELHEAAIVDGATKLQRIAHIDIPGILPTAVILLIMRVGYILDVGFQKVLLMQNPLNISVSEVIQTYVYKVGLASSLPDYSYATAIGLFLSVIGLLLIVVANAFARHVGDTSLW